MVSEDRWSDWSDAQAGTTSRGHLQSWQAAPRAGVALLLVHLIFEYLRLHQILPIIGKLKVQTAIIAALLLIVISQRIDRCSAESPPEVTIGAGHAARCWVAKPAETHGA